MTAMYGLLAAIPMVWGYAGYVMVSHPGTAETDEKRTTMIYDMERGVIWMGQDENGQPVGEVIDLEQYNLYHSHP
jgi:hypothetical protein